MHCAQMHLNNYVNSYFEECIDVADVYLVM